MTEHVDHILTREGYDRLSEELEYLRSVRREEVAESLKLAREMGEADGAEYMGVREEQSFLEGRIASLEKLLAEVEIAEESASGGQLGIAIGSEVAVRDEEGEEEERYLIVGPMEADPASGRISSQSPVGQALMDRGVGDTVEVETPMGTRRLTIVKVS